MDRTRALFGLTLLTLLVLVSARTGTAQNPSTTNHTAVGSWFGRAVQVCERGVAPAACAFGRPAQVLLMTPTLTPDGLFVADDTLTLQSDHLTAHGQWRAINGTEFLADYMFLLKPLPGFPAHTVSGLRARWEGQVVDANTLVGWVNAYLTPAVPVSWTRLAEHEFPGFPSEGVPLVTAPSRFIRDPSSCRTPTCPLVFKFTLKRVAP